MNNVQIFTFQKQVSVSTTYIDNTPYFRASDVCEYLDIQNTSQAFESLSSNQKRLFPFLDKRGCTQDHLFVTEAGVYKLVFQSRKPEAIAFQDWICEEVIPAIRKKGSYIANGRKYKFEERARENLDRVDFGYISVVHFLNTNLYTETEIRGYVIPDFIIDKKGFPIEIRPDVSFGLGYSKWLKKNFPELAKDFTMYLHKFPSGISVYVRQYHKERHISLMVRFFENEWLPKQAPQYFATKYPKAVEFIQIMTGNKKGLNYEKTDTI